MSADKAKKAFDLHTTAGKIADLQARRDDAVSKQAESGVKQHSRGKLTAMERIERLLDEGSFQEIDGLVRHPANRSSPKGRLPPLLASYDSILPHRYELHLRL